MLEHGLPAAPVAPPELRRRRDCWSALLLLAAALSLVWQPYPPAEIDIPNKLRRPAPAHWLGTDSLGPRHRLAAAGRRAELDRRRRRSRSASACSLGVALGCLAAARRGWVEEVVMRAADFTFAFPALLSAIMLTAIYGPGPGDQHRRHRHLQHPGLRAPDARRARSGVVARLRARRARRRQGRAGASRTDHVLPNIANVLIVQATIQFAHRHPGRGGAVATWAWARSRRSRAGAAC